MFPVLFAVPLLKPPFSTNPLTVVPLPANPVSNAEALMHAAENSIPVPAIGSNPKVEDLRAPLPPSHTRSAIRDSEIITIFVYSPPTSG